MYCKVAKYIKMASVKMFCVLFTVTIFFGAIGANVDQDSAAPAGLKSSSSIFPASILRLYHKRPLGHPSHPMGSPHPSAAAPSPVSPNCPTNPNLPSAPPSAPSAQIPPHDSLSQKQQIVYRTQPVAAQKHPHASSPDQLSYDNPTNGNRKLLNKVHIPLRHTYPVPLGATPLNEKKEDNVSSGSTGTLPDNEAKAFIDNTKASPSPNLSGDKVTGNNGDTDTSKNYITFNPKDLPYQPVGNIEASPISVRPGNKVLNDRTLPDNEGKSSIDSIKASPSPNLLGDKVTGDIGDTDNSKNYITFNPKDFPYQPVGNIEASPIPVRPGNKVFNDRTLSDNEGKASIDNIKASPSPNLSDDKVTVNNGGTDNSKNYITFNPKDLPYQPVDNIEASPIPVRPGNKVFNDRSPVIVPSKNKDTSDKEDSNDSKDTDTLNPGDSYSVPADTPEDKVSENQQDVPLDSETGDKPNETILSDKESSNSDDENETSKVDEPQNPLKDLVLNGTSSTKPKLSGNDCTKSIKPTSGVVSSGSSAIENKGHDDETVYSDEKTDAV